MINMGLINTWIVIFSLNINFICAQFSIGDLCIHSKTGNRGTCTPLKECPEEIFRLRNNIIPQQCGFDGLEIVVCCPETKPSVSEYRTPVSISNQKCQEYAKHVFKTALNPTLLVGAANVTVNDCFLQKKELIVDEPFTVRKEFPHMAIIGYGKTEYSNLEWLCSGSLISEKHVLTAAHCTVSKSGPPQKVRLGSISLGKRDEYVQEIVIHKFINHPEYKLKETQYDISILVLRNYVEFTAFVRPACLRSPNEISNSKLISAGFAKYTVDEEGKSKALLKSSMNIISNDVCSSHISRRQKITEQMICAKYGPQQLEIYQDHSEAILQYLLTEPYCMYGIIGVSLNETYSTPEPVKIYTKISPYIEWIESIIWPRSYYKK